nr:hypothetical protein GCM10020241_46580 [Streptoalloteichus tenebrarius]
MGALQITLGLICVAVTVVAVAMLVRTVIQMVRTVRLGQPDPTRNGPIGARVVTTVKEVLGHTRMLKWTKVGIAHWFVMMGFLGMLLVVAEAYGEVFQPSFELPLLGEWAPWNLWVEVLGWATVVGILVLIVIRQLHHPRRAERQSRFAGSHMGRAYFIEGIVLVEGLGVVCIRAVKHAAGPDPPAGLGRPAHPRAGLGRAEQHDADLRPRRDQDPERHGVHRGDLAEHDDGRRLAPLHRVLQHLLQAQRGRRRRPWRGQADDEWWQAAGL